MTSRAPTHGFSLIEALVALAILAITAVSFLRATEANISRVTALETRTAASGAEALGDCVGAVDAGVGITAAGTAAGAS